MQQQIAQEQSVVRRQADDATENIFHDIFVKSVDCERATKSRFNLHPCVDVLLFLLLIIPMLSYILFFNYKPAFVVYVSL
jgi:hypothetical protein